MASYGKGLIAPADYIIENGANYEKYNSGILKQWGSGISAATAINGGTGPALEWYTNNYVTFPITFSSIVNALMTNGSNYHDSSNTAFSISVTGFSAIITCHRQLGCESKPYYWEAIGRWN